jgi:hypothetical protein
VPEAVDAIGLQVPDRNTLDGEGIVGCSAARKRLMPDERIVR